MCIPNLFSKKPIPEKIPDSMQKVVDVLKRCRSKEECVRKAYDSMHEHFQGKKWATWIKFWEIFTWDPNILWPQGGFVHCTNMSYLLRVLLVKSGKFKDDEIILKNAVVYYYHPHRYLKIDVGDKVIDVDVWGSYFGVSFGDYAHGFNCWYKTKEA